MRLLTPFARSQTYRSLLFLVMAVPMAAVALGLFIAGWVTTAVLAITPLVIPLLVGLRGATGLLARGDAVLAKSLLGVDVEPPISSGGRWFWGKGKAVLVDPSFWKQQAYLAIRMVGGFAVAVGIVALIGGALQAIAYPISYRWSSAEIGSWHADTFASSLVFFAVGIVALFVGVHLIGPLARLSGWLVTGLLAPGGTSRGGRRADLARGAAQGARLRRRRLDRDRRDRDAGLGADRRRLLLAGVGDAAARVRARDPRLGRTRRGEAGAAARAGRDARVLDPRRLLGRARALRDRHLGRHRPRLLLAGVDGARRGDPARRARARESLRPGAQARAARRRARADALGGASTTATPSCAASSATCTTARRRGSSRSA